jgi:hypothetical protein
MDDLVCAGGFSQETDSQALYASFITFGEIMDVNIPPDPADRTLKRVFARLFEDMASSTLTQCLCFR